MSPVNISGLDMEMVGGYKYLVVHLHDKLDWLDNTDVLLKTFYGSVMATAIFYVILCWGGE